MIKTDNIPSEIEMLALVKKCIGVDFQGDSKHISELVALTKSSQVKKMVSQNSIRRQFLYLLNSKNAKVRKNTARFLGECAVSDDEDALISALIAEDTHFVIPSIILALGSLGSEKSIDSMSKITEKWRDVQEVNMQSHKTAILSAASKTIDKLKPKVVVISHDLPPLDYCLFPLAGCLDLLQDECGDKKLDTYKSNINSIIFEKTSFEHIKKLRCFDIAMIPIASFNADQDSDDISEKIYSHSKRFVELLNIQYPDSNPRYRIEVKSRDHKTRILIAKKLAALIDSNTNLVNSTSNYIAEFVIEFERNVCMLFCSLSYPLDDRFSYRQKSIPASIKGHVAANIMQFFKPYTTQNASVVDVVCGSGTLLFERAMLSEVGFALGVDIENRAISAARNNSRLLKKEHTNIKNKFDFVLSDSNMFTPKKKFDELVANLPFGARVGDKESSDLLHGNIINRLDEFLHEDGTALLYTTRKSIVRNTLLTSDWKIVAERKFDMGGLSPSVFILRK